MRSPLLLSRTVRRRLVPGLWLAAMALAALVAAPAALAQTRPSTVVISSDPKVPVAGLGVDAVAQFGPPFPQTVRIFYRLTGARTYTQLAATPDPSDPSRFTVAVPGSVVTPRGLEIYAEYTVNGTVFTEPDKDAAGNPIRVPVFIARVRSGVAPGSRQHRMVTVPVQLLPDLRDRFDFDLGGDRPADVFVDDYGAIDPALWRIFRFDPRLDRYVDSPTDIGAIRPGRGFWLISSTGGEFDVERGISTGVGFDGSTPFNSSMDVVLAPGWNQIGSPFTYPIAWADVAGSQDLDLPVGHDGTQYVFNRTVLQPWQGYFVFNGSGRDVTLRFQPTPEASGGGAAFAAGLRQQAGPAATLLRVRATAGRYLDADTYVGWSDEALGGATSLSVRQPPPPGGLDLAVREGGASWAASVRPPGGDRAWDLRLSVPPDAGPTVTLAVEPLAGAAGVSVLDLDRGVRLPVSGGEVQVPVGAGESERRLRIVLGDEGSADAPATLVVGPNPIPAGTEASVYADGPGAGWATVDVVDALGRRVARLHDGPLEPGPASWRWGGSLASVRPAAGLYVVRLVADGRVLTRTLTVVR